MPTPTQGPEFAALLRQYRLVAGLSQEELAERAGLSRRGISDLERGLRQAPYPGTIRRLLEALRLSGPERAALRAAGGHAPAAAGITQAPATGAQPRLELDGLLPDHTAGGAARHNLPVELTSFVGRQQQTLEIERLLATTRLLTLIGTGGVGKTRLALRVARALVDEYADGVWLVELGALADGGLVAQQVSRTLSVREFPGEPLTTTLVAALQSRQLLLILDNCEHVLGACRELSVRLLGACPRVSILTTSREVLGVGGETVWHVPPLSVPGARATGLLERVTISEAAALFVERAEAALPGFAAHAQNGGALADVCRRLDGIPLAIELAAARVRLLALDQLAERVRDGFGLLSSGNSAAPSRQQTLRATIDWSYSLLPEAERHLIEIVSVFAGGWSLEAVEAVASGTSDSPEILNLLGRLVDKSLVVAEPLAEHGPRYRLLETVRQYAEERLAERGGAHAARDRHAAFFVRLLEDTEQAVLGATDETWLNRLEREHDNLRAALHWVLATGDAESALRLAGAAQRFWYLRGYFSEGRSWLDQALDLDAQTESQRALDLSDPTLDTPSTDSVAVAQTQARRLAARAKVLLGIGTLAVAQGDFETARQAETASLRLSEDLNDDAGAAWALTILAQEALYRGDYAQMHELAAEGVAAGRTGRDPVIVALCLVLRDCPGLPGLAWPGDDVASEPNSIPELVEAAEEVLRTSQAIEFRPGVCWSLLVLGGLEALRRDATAARSLWEEGLARAREVGLKQCMTPTLTSLGQLATEQGDTRRAGALLGESLKLARDQGDRLALANCLEALAGLATATGQPERALQIAAAAGSLREAIGASLSPGAQAKLDGWRAAVRVSLDARAAETAWREGQSLPVDALILSAMAMLEQVSEGEGVAAHPSHRRAQVRRARRSRTATGT